MFTGTSGSLLLHPREFIESRNEADAMLCSEAVLSWVEAKVWRAGVERSLFYTGTHEGGGEAAVPAKLFESRSRRRTISGL